MNDDAEEDDVNDWDKPEYQEMIEHLKKASPQKSRKYSGYGLDLSDIDLNYLYENVFDRLAKLEAVVEAAKAYQLDDWKFAGVRGFRTWGNVLEALADLEEG